jgi:hypothetical protein
VLTYNRLGFDDYAWLADVDLDIIVNAGKRDTAALELEMRQVHQTIQEKESVGAKVPEPLRQQLRNKTLELESAKEKLQPYEAEQAQRRGRTSK